MTVDAPSKVPASASGKRRKLATLVLAALSIGLHSDVQGATVKWIGGSGSSSNWSDALNWLGFNRPNNDGEDKVRFAGNATRITSTVNQGYSIRELAFEYDDVFGDLISESFTVGGTGWIGVRSGVTNRTDLTQTVTAPVRFDSSGSISTTADSTGTLSLQSLYLNGRTVFVNANGGPINITGEISGGEPNTTLVVTGTNAVTFSGANTWSGELQVTGRLVYGSGFNLGSTGVNIVLAGTLARTGSGTTVLPISVNGDSSLEVGSGLTVTYSGAFTGTNSGTLSKTGSGTVILNNQLSYLSNTTVSAGTLRLEGQSLLPDTQLTVSTGGTLSYAGGKDDTIAGLSGGGTIVLDGGSRLQSGQGATLGGGGTFSGSIQGTAGRFDKAGFGILNLTGSSTFGGGTVVSGGTLLANNTTGSATGSGTVTVNTNATLGGSGRITGPITLQSGATLAPSSATNVGTGIGNLRTGNLTFVAGSTLAIEFANSGAVDLVESSGAVTLNGTLSLSRIGNTLITDSALRIIMTTTGTISGRFAAITGQRQSDTQWFAVVYTPTSIQAGLARPGDASLDGFVNFEDLVLLARSFNTAGQSWIAGDFNGDSTVNFADLVLLARNFNTGPNGGSLALAGGGSVGDDQFRAAWASALSQVPEPASLLLLAAGAMLALRRRSH